MACVHKDEKPGKFCSECGIKVPHKGEEEVEGIVKRVLKQQGLIKDDPAPPAPPTPPKDKKEGGSLLDALTD